MNPKKFLKELRDYDSEKYKIVTTLRNLILKANKNASEEIKYGGLLYSDKKPYTGLFVSKNHVSMEFSEGAKFTDPKNILEGSGKYRRHLKLKTLNDIKRASINNFLKQALKNQK